MVKKALKVLNKIELLVIYITFGGMIFAAFAQVIFRLILKSPLAWSEEVCRYCFVWLDVCIFRLYELDERIISRRMQQKG